MPASSPALVNMWRICQRQSYQSRSATSVRRREGASWAEARGSGTRVTYRARAAMASSLPAAAPLVRRATKSVVSRIPLACRACRFPVAPGWRRCPDCGALAGAWWRRLLGSLAGQDAPSLIAQEAAAASRQRELVAKQAELDGLRRELADRRATAAEARRDTELLDRAAVAVEAALADARRAERRYRDLEAEVAVARERFRLAALGDALEAHLTAPVGEVETWKHIGLAAGVHAFAPGATHLARSWYRTFLVEDLTGARPQLAWQVALDRPVSSLAFDRNGRYVAVALAAQADQVDARVLVHEVGAGRRVAELVVPGAADGYGRVASMAFTSTGIAAVVVPVHGRCEPELRLWSLTGSLIARQALRVMSGRVVVSSDGNRLAVADGVGGILLYRAGDLLHLREVRAPSAMPLAFVDGDLLHQREAAMPLDFEDGDLLIQREAATPLAFVDGDSHLLFSHAGDRDDVLAVTEVNRPDCVRDVARGGDRLAASLDGSVAITWSFDAMRVHCVRSWHLLAELRWPGPVRCAAITSDGRHVVAAIERPSARGGRHDYLMRWEWGRGRPEGLSCELRHTARRARARVADVRDADVYLREAVALGALVVRRRAAELDPRDPADDRRAELVFVDALGARDAGAAGPVPSELTRLLDDLPAGVLAARLAAVGRAIGEAAEKAPDEARAGLERCEAALRRTAEWAGHRELARSPVAVEVRRAAERSLGLVQSLIDHTYVARVPAAIGAADAVADLAHAEGLRHALDALVEELDEKAAATLEVEALEGDDGDRAAVLEAAVLTRRQLLDELDREATRRAAELAAVREVERLLTAGE